MTLSPERYAGLLKLKIHLIRPPASCVHVPPHLPRGAASQNSHRHWKFVSPFAIVRSVDSSSLAAFPRHMCSIPDQRFVLQTRRHASWRDPLTRLGLSGTPQGAQPEAPTALQDQQWRHMRKGTSHQLRAGVERARICFFVFAHLVYDLGSLVMPCNSLCQVSCCCQDDFDGQHFACGVFDWS